MSEVPTTQSDEPDGPDGPDGDDTVNEPADGISGVPPEPGAGLGGEVEEDDDEAA